MYLLGSFTWHSQKDVEDGEGHDEDLNHGRHPEDVCLVKLH